MGPEADLHGMPNNTLCVLRRTRAGPEQRVLALDAPTLFTGHRISKYHCYR